MIRWLAVLLLLTFAVPAQARRIKLEEPAEAAAASSNRFGFDLYARLAKTGGNLFFSPYSISVALSMTAEGARGDTARQMNTVLHRVGGRAGTGHEALAKALLPRELPDGWGEDAKKRPTHEIRIANALWGQEGLGFEKPFLDRLVTSYGAPLERIDFRKTAAARDRINAWVAEHTKRRILDIIPPDLPTPDTLLALANAIHFKAAWKKPFKDRLTADAPFTTSGGRKVTVPTMRRVGDFRLSVHEKLAVVELDHFGGATSLVIIMPRDTNRLADLEKTLDHRLLPGVLAALKPGALDLRLPKFSFTNSHDLGATLPAMGMKNAFLAGKADFTGMTTESPLFIGAVLHKAFVAVDEAGTEAAAATVVMMLKGGPPAAPPVLKVDRPFFFLIRHKSTGCILFMGRVTDPTKS